METPASQDLQQLPLTPQGNKYDFVLRVFQEPREVCVATGTEIVRRPTRVHGTGEQSKMGCASGVYCCSAENLDGDVMRPVVPNVNTVGAMDLLEELFSCP